ncbi:MAG TPA: CbiX/SirB N-terminal domain-containing protein [Jatrophihabitantaceae bacterium]|jgi:sirohydrochlorin ferrochelatase|nr:CbiX/SirB N-terminal domain-containing protein [Jatrophihabitantaceae bacterium]
MPVTGASSEPAALLVVAHGTASASGLATTQRLVAAVGRARPGVAVRLCFLDVASPTLAEALDTVPRPTVVVPLLLSTGYHVTVDIPGTVAGHPHVHVARHLGPHPLLADAMVDRLREADADGAGGSTLMVAAGSTQPAAAQESAAAAALLAERLGGSVTVVAMADDLDAAIGRATPPVHVATYLLAEGQFVDRLNTAAAGHAVAAAPLGTHPAVVELVWTRYDEAVASAVSAR